MRILFVMAALTAMAYAGGADAAATKLKKGDAEGAAVAARKLAEKDPSNVDAWLVLADALIAQGEPSDAWTALETAMEANPKDARLSLKLGDVFVKMAEAEQAGGKDGTTIMNYYLDAERMYAEALQKDPKSADAVYGMAYANFYANRKDKARKFISQCLGMQKDHARCLALQAFLFYGERKYPEAERIYEAALKLDDSDPTNMVRYGHTLLVQKKLKEAKAAYIACLKRHPDTHVPIVSGLFYVAGKNWRGMAPILKEAAAAAPKSAPTWYYLAYVHDLNGDTRDAEAAYKAALKIQPQNAHYMYGVGYMKEKQGDARGALAMYRKALKAMPGHPKAAARFEGMIQGMRNDIDAAETLYGELLDLAPQNGWVRNNFALMLRNWAEPRGASKQENLAPDVRRRIKRSAQVYEQAAKLLPKEAQVQSDTGLLFEFYPAIRDDKKAEKYFVEALVISEWTYRDAWSGILRLARKTKNWALLKEHAEAIIDSLENYGRHIKAPVGGGVPRELPNQTPMILEQAKAALRLANKGLGKGG